MKIDEIKDMILEDQKKVKDLNSLNDLKVKYLGKKGLISELNQEIRNIPNEEKKDFGKKVNELKNIFNDFYESKKNELETINLNEKLKSEAIDISLPAYNIKVGAPNILEKLIEEVESVCMSMGYDVVDGPEIEEDKYNFEMLNIPKGHPARDAQDTFYLEGEEILLRSQTSPVQVRTMLKGKGKVPIRMICPGKATITLIPAFTLGAPHTICNLAFPTSTLHTFRWSLSGCFSQVRTFPITKLSI